MVVSGEERKKGIEKERERKRSGRGEWEIGVGVGVGVEGHGRGSAIRTRPCSTTSSSAPCSNTYWLNDSALLNIISVLAACFIFHMLQVVEGGGVSWRQFRCAGGTVARQAGVEYGPDVLVKRGSPREHAIEISS